jgi:hypothetical protein
MRADLLDSYVILQCHKKIPHTIKHTIRKKRAEFRVASIISTGVVYRLPESNKVVFGGNSQLFTLKGPAFRGKGFSLETFQI